MFYDVMKCISFGNDPACPLVNFYQLRTFLLLFWLQPTLAWPSHGFYFFILYFKSELSTPTLIFFVCLSRHTLKIYKNIYTYMCQVA